MISFLSFEVSMQEAQLAKAKMNGRLACGRPLVVRLASEKQYAESSTPLQAASDPKNPNISGSKVGQSSRSAKIAAIKNKLKSLEEEGYNAKRPRLQKDDITDDHKDLSAER